MDINTIFVMFLVAISCLTIGFLSNAVWYFYKQHQKTSWLILRLMEDYNREMSSKEIVEQLLVGSMGLVNLSSNTIYSILETQHKSGFIKITSAPDGLESAIFVLTAQGKTHLERITELVHAQYEELT